ncbi:MAG: class I tRNA ligase family protein [Planctomycetota bacterium]
MTFYITTPIYYVNDRPHIGHVYTTTVADALARYHRLAGDDTFFLTGTDEHASKVVDAAAERDLSPLDWATRNANVFKDTFDRLRITNDDFIRTTEPRHTQKVTEYLRALLQPADAQAEAERSAASGSDHDDPNVSGGDVYPGTYEGWYDPGEEEYVPEARAREHGYKSPISGRDLVKRTEQNFYFRLSKYAPQVIAAMESGEFDVQPEARKNEIINRLKEAQDVPISREGKSTEQGGWGIAMPSLDGEPTGHTVYVWIDALFNYLTTVDTDDRRKYWEGGATHLIAKDILWFHAAIWPAMLLALKKRAGYEWVRLPKLVYAHSFWIAEGKKMSKTLGNFIDLEKIDATIDAVGELTTKLGEKASEAGGFADFGRGLDALRYFLCKDGPMGTTDADFAEKAFWETYNADLANTLGNSFNRVANMTHKYFEGVVQEANHGEHGEYGGDTEIEQRFKALATLHDGDREIVAGYIESMNELTMDHGVGFALDLVSGTDSYIEATAPFKIAKDESRLPEVGAILYNCAEALRIASVLLWPVIPDACEKVWARLGLGYAARLRDGGAGCLDAWTQWGGLQPGTTIEKGDPLFPRYREQ